MPPAPRMGDDPPVTDAVRPATRPTPTTQRTVRGRGRSTPSHPSDGRTTRRRVAGAVVVALSASACGGGGGPAASEPGAGPATTASTASTEETDADELVASVVDVDLGGEPPEVLDWTAVLAGDVTLVGLLAPVVAEVDPELTPLLDALPDLVQAERAVFAELAPELAVPEPGGPGEALRLRGPALAAPSAAPPPPRRRPPGAVLGLVAASVAELGDQVRNGMKVGASSSSGGATVGFEATLGGAPGGAQAFDLKMTVETPDGRVEGTVKGVVEADPCPDESGRVTGDFSISIDAAGSGAPGTLGRQQRVQGTVTVHVDDAAQRKGIDAEWTATAANQSGGRNSFVEARSTGRFGVTQVSDGRPETEALDRTIDVTRRSQDAVATDVDEVAELAGRGLEFLVVLTNVWEQAWRSGKCVRVSADVPERVAVAARVPIEAEVVHRDGQELPLPIDVTLSGPASVDPARIDAAPGTVTYVAGDQPDQTGTLTWTTTSRRGIGTLRTPVTTNRSLAYRVAGGADDLVVDDVVCDLTAPFTVEGSGVVQQFTPASDTGGTYTYTGTIEGFAVTGEGTYRIELPDGAGRPGTMTATGVGSVETPQGVFSNEGTEIYSLTPFEPSADDCAPT